MTLINASALLSIKKVLFSNLKVSKGYLALLLSDFGVELQMTGLKFAVSDRRLPTVEHVDWTDYII